MILLLRVIAGMCALLATLLPAVARDALPAPGGAVILTVSGTIEQQNSNGAALFDRAMLRTLDWREVETFTKWTAGPQTFAGPTLASLLEAVDAQGTRLQATALNDYRVEIPASDAEEHGVILAMEHDGTVMGVRQKGPIWILYPHGSQDAAERTRLGHRMIWQTTRIRVLP